MRSIRRRVIVSALVGAIGVVATQVLGAQEVYWPTHGWRRATPESQGMDSRVLSEAFDYIHQHGIPIHSWLIVRNGYVVLEAYFWPFRDSTLHDVASVTKSVTSTLVGIAVGKHNLNASQPVLSAFGARPVAHLDPRKEHLTIEHLLTMTSGLDCHRDHGEITLSQMTRSSNWNQFMLDLPMIAEPGSKFEYCSGGMHLLSGALSKGSGVSMLDFARRELFGPLGIREVAWPADRQGITRGWGDLHLQPRDMAKIGYLWLHDGRWEDHQLVPTDFMRSAVAVHAHPGFNPGQEYGYGFWIYPDRNPPQFEGLGRGGQRISVVPDKNLVVVFSGGEFEPGDVGSFIGRALKSDAALPEDSAGAARLAALIDEATRPPASQPISRAPQLAKVVSGRTYVLDTNPLDLRSFVLTFEGSSPAQLQLELSDRLDGPRPIGLDGVPRVSSNGRFGLPVAVAGAWEGDSVFVLDYNEIGNINRYRFRMAFTNKEVTVELSERSRVVGEARVHGRSK